MNSLNGMQIDSRLLLIYAKAEVVSEVTGNFCNARSASSGYASGLAGILGGI